MYVNGTKQDNGKVMTVDYANNHVSELGFDEVVATDKPGKLLNDAINPIVDEFKADFEAAVKKYDSMTLHSYLSQELGWSEAKINYVEVLTSQTNEFRSGLVDFLLLRHQYGKLLTMECVDCQKQWQKCLAKRILC